MSNAPHHVSDHWLETAGGRLFARCWQPRAANLPAPIVLLHDSLGCVALWRNFPALLAEHTGRTVIAYDRLGFGQSDPQQKSPGMDFVPAEATSGFAALREHFGLERFVLLGHSVGGGMAVHCAAQHAAGCEALVTIAAQAFVEERTRTGIIEAREQFAQPEPFERLRRYHGDKARWVLQAWIDTWLAPAFADWSLQAVLPRVHCPTLVLHGAEDEYGSSLHPQQIAGLVAGPAQLEIMPGVRHMPHREQEHWVLQRIGRFLDAGRH